MFIDKWFQTSDLICRIKFQHDHCSLFSYPHYHFKMAEQTGNTMVLANSLILEAKKNRKERENRRKLKNFLLLQLSRKRKTVVCSWFQVILLLTNLQTVAVQTPRACKRFPRVQGWWGNIWNCSDDVRFRMNFGIKKGTFLFILAEIKEDLQPKTTAEVPIPPESRLAVCLYRLLEWTISTLLEN